MLRIAVVGVGWAGTRQAQAAQEIPDQVQVAALVDTDAVFLREKAAELGVSRTYTDYAQALADPEIDAVSICTPHALHAPMAREAAAAGKHVLVEKPMALTVDEATRMIEAAEQHGVQLYVAENEPYTPMSQFLRAFLQDGRIGELTHVLLANGFRAEDFGYPGRRAWLTELDRGGTGTWMLHGIHTVAQLRYILGPVAGEVETVYLREHKTASYRRRDLEGTISGLLTFASGLHLSIMQSSETRLPGNLNGYIFHGETGSLRAGREGGELFTAAGDDEPAWLDYPAETLSSYAQELAAFARYVAGAEPGPTTAASERRSLAVVQAGYESMQSGQPVHLPGRFGNR
jgi:predicted dehydrogenase